MVYLHANFSGGLRKTIISARVRFDRSRSSKVIDFGTNRKLDCDFLLVRHSNFGPVLHRFRDIFQRGFLCSWPHPYSTLNFVPVWPDRRCWVSVSRYLKLLGRQIIFEVFQLMWSRYLNVADCGTDRRRDGRTDRRTDDIQYCGITALSVASRGKNTNGQRITNETSSPAAAEKELIVRRCWRRLFQTWKFWRFACSRYSPDGIKHMVLELENLRRYGRRRGNL